MNKIIDLRSDTVTKPTKGMLHAMMLAEVGDDVYGEDFTVNLLQEKTADLFGKEAALFVPSGTMGNQLCLRTHTEPGDEVICDYQAHIFNYESGAAGNLSQVQLHPLHGEHGILSIDLIKKAIRQKAYWNPWTKLIALENTVNKAGGTIYTIERMKEIYQFAKEKNIQVHVDGARIWNAHAVTGVSLKDYGSVSDSLSVCFSKGLGAPVGSVILGTKEFITKAHRYRKMWGGGMRQVGILAAACLYALDHHIERLKEDTFHAKQLGLIFQEIPGFRVQMELVQSNIVMVDVSQTEQLAGFWTEKMKEVGILASPFSDEIIRLVTHLDISLQDIKTVAEKTKLL